MASNLYIIVDEEARPTEESIQAAKEEGLVETRSCAGCQEPVSIGERVAVLTANGEEWRHSWHT